MLLSVCKKLGWPKYQQKIIKEEKTIILEKKITKRKTNFYFVFKQSLSPVFWNGYRKFEPESYIKKGMPSDTVKIISGDKKEAIIISLYEHILERIKINAASAKLLGIYGLFTLRGFDIVRELATFEKYPELIDEIYFALKDVYMPENNTLFYNIDKAKQEIGGLSEEKNRRIYVVFFSFSLFFIERFHNYILDLLQYETNLKIQLYGLKIEADGFLDIYYAPSEIASEDLTDRTKIITGNDNKTISVDEKITEIIDQYKNYVSELAHKTITIYNDTWFMLYNFGVNAFIVYTLAYLYHVLDLERLFDYLSSPKKIDVEVKLGGDTVYIRYAPKFLIQTPFIIPKGSSLENIIRKKVSKDLKNDETKYIFYNGSNNTITLQKSKTERALINFMLQNREKKNTVPAFLLFEKYGTIGIYRVSMPIAIGSLFLFYKSIYAKDGKTIDHIYKLAHNALYNNENE